MKNLPNTISNIINRLKSWAPLSSGEGKGVRLFILLAFPLASASGYAQSVPVNPTLPAWHFNGLFAKNILVAPTYANQAALPTLPVSYPSSIGTLYTRGAIAYTIAENKHWKWNGSGWTEMAGATFTTADARAAISLTTTGTSGAATYNSSTGVLNVPNYRATPAGSTGEIQFNNSGILGSSSILFWDNGNSRLGIGTSSPSERFHFVGSIIGSRIQMTFSGANTTNADGGFRLVAQVGAGTLGSIGSLSAVGVNNSQTSFRSNLVMRGLNATQFTTGTFFEFRPNNTYSESSADDTRRRARIYADGSIWSDTEVNSAPNSTAVMELATTSRGFLPPRLSTSQRNTNIPSPATGLTIYCTDCTATDGSTGVMQTYNGSTWKNHW